MLNLLLLIFWIFILIPLMNELGLYLFQRLRKFLWNEENKK